MEKAGKPKTLERSPIIPRKIMNTSSANVPFPAGFANMTAVQILTFLPRAMDSWDVIERFSYNECDLYDVEFIIKCKRNGGPPRDALLERWQHIMRGREPAYVYKNWRQTRSGPPPGWDPTSISVAGFTTPVESYKSQEPTEHIQFFDMTQGINEYPTGLDALDLTRCVQYHVNNQHENWIYPQMYHELLAKLGGPAMVTRCHQDGVVFTKWKGICVAAIEAVVTDGSLTIAQTHLSPSLNATSSSQISREHVNARALPEQQGIRGSLEHSNLPTRVESGSFYHYSGQNSMVPLPAMPGNPLAQYHENPEYTAANSLVYTHHQQINHMLPPTQSKMPRFALNHMPHTRDGSTQNMPWKRNKANTAKSFPAPNQEVTVISDDSDDADGSKHGVSVRSISNRTRRQTFVHTSIPNNGDAHFKTGKWKHNPTKPLQVDRKYDSELEQDRRDWRNYKKHGFAGLYIGEKSKKTRKL